MHLLYFRKNPEILKVHTHARAHTHTHTHTHKQLKLTLNYIRKLAFPSEKLI